MDREGHDFSRVIKPRKVIWALALEGSRLRLQPGLRLRSSQRHTRFRQSTRDAINLRTHTFWFHIFTTRQFDIQYTPQRRSAADLISPRGRRNQLALLNIDLPALQPYQPQPASDSQRSLITRQRDMRQNALPQIELQLAFGRFPECCCIST